MINDYREIEKRLAITHVLEKDDLIVLKECGNLIIEDGDYAWKIEWFHGYLDLSYGRRIDPLFYNCYTPRNLQSLNDNIIKAKQHFLEFISIPHNKRLWGYNHE